MTSVKLNPLHSGVFSTEGRLMDNKNKSLSWEQQYQFLGTMEYKYAASVFNSGIKIHSLHFECNFHKWVWGKTLWEHRFQGIREISITVSQDCTQRPNVSNLE